MTYTLTPTDVILDVRGAPVRMWRGHRSDGQPVRCFIALVAVEEHAPPDPLEAVQPDGVPPPTDDEVRRISAACLASGLGVF